MRKPRVEPPVLRGADGPFTNQPGGTVEGYGAINLNSLGTHTLANAGTIAPGMSIGTLSITGNLGQAASGILGIEIGAVDSNDLLVVSGSAALDGVIQVALLGGYVPSVGDSFRVLNYGSHTGSFQGAVTVAGGDVTWSVQSLEGFTQITVEQVPAPGVGLFGAAGVTLLGIAHRRRRA